MNKTTGFPKHGEIKKPLLNEIDKRGGQASPSELYETLADYFHLTPQQRIQKYPKSGFLIWSTRLRSLRDHLVKSGELDGSVANVWKITSKGLAFLNGTSLPFKVDITDSDAVSLTKDSKTLSVPVVAPKPPKAVQPLLQIAERTHNILLYGPPGTGKTWLVAQFAKAFTDPDKVKMVTFHQSFAYEEFVEGIKPVIVEGQVAYDVVDGVFKRICQAARENPDSQYLLIIDEINRANIAKVLGELITLIEDDKRLGQANEVQVTLPYSGKPFGVPHNLTLLGTMNTADRSIALLDLALRRRFTFVEMAPDPTLLNPDVAGVNLQSLLLRLNKRVAALLDRDHQIGHSYLMGADDADGLHFAWYRRVVPLLQEYFYGDGERLQAVLGNAFVRLVPPDPETKSSLGGAYEEVDRYEVQWLEMPAFLGALRRLAGESVAEEAP